MEMSIEWGQERKHDGNGECPAEARDVQCAVYDENFGWIGKAGATGLDLDWENVTAYRLPVNDPVREALVKALEFYADRGFDGYDVVISDYGLSQSNGHIIKDGGEKARAAITLAKEAEK